MTITCQTPDEISIFRLLSVKHQLNFEKMGMKSSGGALRPRLAKEFGLKPRDSYEMYIAAVQKKIDEVHAAREA